MVLKLFFSSPSGKTYRKNFRSYKDMDKEIPILKKKGFIINRGDFTQ